MIKKGGVTKVMNSQKSLFSFFKKATPATPEISVPTEVLTPSQVRSGFDSLLRIVPL